MVCGKRVIRKRCVASRSNRHARRRETARVLPTRSTPSRAGRDRAVRSPTTVPGSEKVSHGIRARVRADACSSGHFHRCSATRRATRSLISSRIARTVSSGWPLGSLRGQSSRSAPGTTGHASPHPIVTSIAAPAASSSVKIWGFCDDRWIPISLITLTTSGCTRTPGSVPAGRSGVKAMPASFSNTRSRVPAWPSAPVYSTQIRWCPTSRC